MGARIAAHIANAGFPVLLLDLVPEGATDRNVLAASIGGKSEEGQAAGICRSLRRASNITVGNFEDDLEKLTGCDWILEAVAENLDIKRALLARIAPLYSRQCHRDHQHQRPAGRADCERHA